MSMTKQEALAKIAELTNDALAKIRQAEKIAEEHQVSFSFGLEYGMGGTFDEDWDSSDWDESDDEGNTNSTKKPYRWHPSSESC